MPNAKPDSIDKKQLRMDAEHSFQFHCYPGVPCFTECCRDVTIALTPYDVVRLKNRLEMTSGDFLDQYTIVIPKKKRLIPLVVLKMNQEDKKCPFVSSQGCSVYEDRPWPCRMFPLDINEDGTFRLITDASRCKGLNEEDTWRINEWLMDQGVVVYDQMNHLFNEVTAPLLGQDLDIDNPDIMKMIFMALYNLDAFRDFVFKSTFLDRFDIDDKKLEKIKRDDTELMIFGFDWIKFGILGQILFTIKQGQEEKDGT